MKYLLALAMIGISLTADADTGQGVIPQTVDVDLEQGAVTFRSVNFPW